MSKNCSFLISLIAVSIYFVIGLFVLSNGHPHEDAFILYKYSENLSSTGIISYIKGGAPAEGATDFLWMLFLAAMNLIGFNTGISSLILNALGIILVCVVIIKVSNGITSSLMPKLIVLSYTIVSPISISSYGGFSTSLYVGLILALFFVFYENKKYVVFAPILGLLVSLFRPDGALIASMLVLMNIVNIRRDERRAYIVISGVAGVLGVGYFIWRMNYFGEVLPLPLLVKSNSDNLLPGLVPNIQWFTSVPFLAAASFYAIFKRNEALKDFSNIMPFAIYALFLCFANQTQNVAYRFQAPLLSLLLFYTTIALSYMFDRGEKSRKPTAEHGALLILAIIIISGAANSTKMHVDRLLETEYINYFPKELAKDIDSRDVIALTEAGRFAYWMDARIYDLVGLNTREFAHGGPTVSSLKELEPDLLFVHQAGLLDGIRCSGGEKFCEVTVGDLERVGIERRVKDYATSEDHVRKSVAVFWDYVTQKRNEYVIYVVEYAGNYNHVYALKIGGRLSTGSFWGAMERAHQDVFHKSYLEMKRF